MKDPAVPGPGLSPLQRTPPTPLDTPPDLLLGRIVATGLIAWMAWIHLHLWSAGYRHIHTVGPFFLVDFVIGMIAALVVLSVDVRWLPRASGAAFIVVAATLTGLIISLRIGLFGFKDTYDGPFVQLALWVEGAALLVLAALVTRSTAYLRRLSPRAGTGAGATDVGGPIAGTDP